MKEFSTIICFSIIIYGVLEMLSPNSGNSVLFKRIISVIMIFSIICSVKIFINKNWNFEFDSNNEEINATVLENYYEILTNQTKDNIKRQIEELLDSNNCDYNSIDVAINYIQDNITLENIYVYINQYNNENVAKIKSLLKEKFNINIIVKEVS